MAAGGYVDVPGGYSANDNMMAMVPVASGERIYVDPMTNRRGTAGGGMVINISSPITINGNANADQFGRTVYQTNQLLAKQVTGRHAMTHPGLSVARVYRAGIRLRADVPQRDPGSDRGQRTAVGAVDEMPGRRRSQLWVADIRRTRWAISRPSWRCTAHISARCIRFGFATGRTTSPMNEVFGTGDGTKTAFQLSKTYDPQAILLGTAGTLFLCPRHHAADRRHRSSRRPASSRRRPRITTFQPRAW